MGTAGFGAVLAHRRPILDGGFSPDGFGSEDGRTGSVLEVTTVDVDDAADVELVSDILSEDGAGTGAGDGSTEVSWASLIFLFHFTFITPKKLKNTSFN